MSRFKGEVAVVTGGASGIGKATCLALAAEGAVVAVADRDEPRAKAVAEEIAAAGGTGFPLVVDITSHAAVEAAVASVVEQREHIDVLVNCAGWDYIAPFVETGPDVWDRVIAINFRGLLSFVRCVLPGMMARKSGRIVNVSSDAGRAGSSGEAVYSGAKGGIIAFTKSLAREVSRSGIRVNCVAPGLTETPLLAEVRQGHERLMEAIVRATPLGRTAQPAEIAAAILFFAGPESSFITGQTLSISGGLTMM